MDNCVYIEINRHVWCGGEKKSVKSVIRMLLAGFMGYWKFWLERKLLADIVVMDIVHSMDSLRQG